MNEIEYTDQKLKRIYQNQTEIYDLFVSENLLDKSIAYDVVTNKYHLKNISNYEYHTCYSSQALKYLIECVRRDIKNSEIIHSRAEACWELSVPLFNFDGYEVLSEDDYWCCIRDFLSSKDTPYYDSVVTHFLEGWGVNKRFCREMVLWKKNSKLKKYVCELEEILNRKFE